MNILLIAAISTNRVIGRNGKTPWYIPEELAFFKTTTMGHPIIMGRTTFESLPFILPGRRHIVLSRDPPVQPRQAEWVTSLEQAIELCAGSETVFVIGGAQLFALALPLATGIVLSVLDRAVDGDVFFPEINLLEFQEISRKPHTGSEPFMVIAYQRLKA